MLDVQKMLALFGRAYLSVAYGICCASEQNVNSDMKPSDRVWYLTSDLALDMSSAGTECTAQILTGLQPHRAVSAAITAPQGEFFQFCSFSGGFFWVYQQELPEGTAQGLMLIRSFCHGPVGLSNPGAAAGDNQCVRFSLASTLNRVCIPGA